MLRRRVHALQHLVPRGKQEQPEGGPHLVPERAAGTEEGAHALIHAIDQLKDLVHEERQQVERKERLRQVPVAVAEIVLQVVALVLQGVERLILDLPTRPRGAHQLDDVVGGGHQVGDPGIAIFHLAVLDDPELDEVDERRVGLAVQRQTGDPLVLVAFAAVDGMMAVQQVAAAQAGNILVQVDMVTWFGDQQERETPRGQLLDAGLLGVKAVGDDNCRHPGIVGAEPLKHPVAGIDFAILLVVLVASAVTVEYELGSEGEHHAFVRMHDGGLQDVMMMALDAVCGGAQAALATDQFGAEVA